MLKNILMIGLIGVGKIEIFWCLVKLVQVFFIKIEVIKFIEVGYVGWDVDQIVWDLVEIVISFVCEKKCEEVKVQVYVVVENCVLEVLVGFFVSEFICESF